MDETTNNVLTIQVIKAVNVPPYKNKKCDPFVQLFFKGIFVHLTHKKV